MRKGFLKQSIRLLINVMAALLTSYATADNFNCPHPAEIQSTDFTAPSIWVAPPVAHSVPGMVGVGLGGKEVKEFIGAEPAKVNHKEGWVCVYKSAGGISIHEYQSKILAVAGSNHYLRKYFSKISQTFDEAEPYLSKFPSDEPIGFVGYQQEESDDYLRKHPKQLP